MRKGLLILVCVACMGAVMAEEPVQPVAYEVVFPRHYLQLSVGDSYVNHWCNEQLVYLSGGQIDRGAADWFMPDVYNGQTAYVPTFSLSYYYAVKRWLHVGIEVYYSGQYTAVCDRLSGERTGTLSISGLSVLPAIRFQYYDRPKLGLYSGLSLGADFVMGYGYDLYNRQNLHDEYEYLFAFQATALGVRFGDRVYGLMELGFGHKGILSIGVGARLK